MEFWWMVPVFGGLLTSVILTNLILHVAMYFEIMDIPDGKRKQHQKSTPLLGGVAVYAATVFATLPVLLFTDQFTFGDIDPSHFIGFYLGGALLILGGVLDDRFSLPARKSIAFPILATVAAILGGMSVSRITNPLGGAPLELTEWISHLFTFIWIMGMIYTTKLLDGHDGLATGISTIAAVVISLLALTTAFYQPDVALFGLIFSAVLTGFWLWNAPPAVLFLGESGSTFLGYTIGILSIISGSKIATALLVMGIPILDIVFVLIGRWRAKKPLFTSPDRFHLHFRLKDAGLTDWQVLGLYYALALGFGLTTLVFESWQKIFSLGLLLIIMMILVSRLSKKNHA